LARVPAVDASSVEEVFFGNVLSAKSVRTYPSLLPSIGRVGKGKDVDKGKKKEKKKRE
jgi:hypothetical protein